MNLLLIPEPALIKIFAYSKNLIALTATCRAFQDIIEFNSSLMSHITVHFVHGPILCPLDLYRRRRYHKIEILLPELYTAQVFDVLELQKLSLRQLKVRFSIYPMLFPFFNIPPFVRTQLMNWNYHGDYFGSTTNVNSHRFVELLSLTHIELHIDRRGVLLQHLIFNTANPPQVIKHLRDVNLRYLTRFRSPDECFVSLE